MFVFKDLSQYFNKKFGEWTVIGDSGRKQRSRRYVDVVCSCGNRLSINWVSIKNGTSKSCGCVKKKGLQGRSHPLYQKWVNMKQRCYNEKYQGYRNYGGRGVSVCKEWVDSFDCFYQWSIHNGWENGLELDKDVKGNGLVYSPQTCCFITHIENMQTRRINKLTKQKALEIKDSIETTKILSEKYGVCKDVVYKIRRGVIWK